MRGTVEPDGRGIGIGHGPADVVVAAQVGNPGGRHRCRAPGERVLGEAHVAGRQRQPEHDHELVVVGQVALRPVPVVTAEVLHQHVRADDGLGLQDQARGGQPRQGAERLQQQVSLRLVLAVGAHPLPQERRRVQPQHVNAVVGQGEHRPEHGAEDGGVGVVQIPLIVVERRPYPAQPRHLSEAAGRGTGKDLRQRPLVGVGLGAVGIDQVHLTVGRLPGGGLACPFVLACGVVQDQVNAQRDAALAQVAGEFLEVGHGADPWIHRVVVLHRIAAVVLPVARPEQWHQVQVGDAQFGQVVQVPTDAGQGAGRTGRRNTRSRPSGTAGTRQDRSRGGDRAAAAPRGARLPLPARRARVRSRTRWCRRRRRKPARAARRCRTTDAPGGPGTHRPPDGQGAGGPHSPPPGRA